MVSYGGLTSCGLLFCIFCTKALLYPFSSSDGLVIHDLLVRSHNCDGGMYVVCSVVCTAVVEELPPWYYL
jgi:hypothetical protein